MTKRIKISLLLFAPHPRHHPISSPLFSSLLCFFLKYHLDKSHDDDEESSSMFSFTLSLYPSLLMGEFVSHLISCMFLIHGEKRMRKGKTGRKNKEWSAADRIYQRTTTSSITFHCSSSFHRIMIIRTDLSEDPHVGSDEKKLSGDSTQP